MSDGYTVVEGVFRPDDLARLSALAGRCVAAIAPEHRARYRSEGSLVLIADHPAFAEFVAYRRALDAFARLGLTGARFSAGYVISKPPKSPALFWHQDWWGWDDPISLSDRICQFFVFCYLTDTRPENGCLRVIPGTHRRRHAMHDLMDAHSDTLARVDDPEKPAFADHRDAVAVPVRAGDMVIGDARLIHGSFPNASDRERTLITLWYHPDYDTLSEPIRARIQEIFERRGVDTDTEAPGGLYPGTWPESERSRVTHLLPDYSGGAAPQPWNRTPVGLL
ncbi:MAG: phytanoyl-CoA dioxygenase family protein [Alphaproteobacteria bacterium]